MNPNEFDSKRRTVAQYGRFAVIHDPLVHRPYGLYRIYERARYIGALISFPGAADCETMASNLRAVHAVAAPGRDWRTHYRRGATAPANLKWHAKRAA